MIRPYSVETIQWYIQVFLDVANAVANTSDGIRIIVDSNAH